MATSLISNVNSEAQHQANLLTNTPNLIKVMVEDEVDVVVWYKILSLFAPEGVFDIHPYSFDPDIHGKGKVQILKMSSQFGKHFIGCVDSDYDWLLEQWTSDGKIIRNSPYILQTYAYSIENLAVQPYGVADSMMECCLHSCDLIHSLDEDYRTFIKYISNSVYDILLWHLTLKKDGGHSNIIHTGTEDLFGNGHYNNIISDHTLSIREKRKSIIALFSLRATQLSDDYAARFPDLLSQRETLEKNLCSPLYGLTRENAYLFVRGHNIYDFLLHTFFRPLHTHLRQEHEREIRVQLSTGVEIRNAITHYHKLLMSFENGHVYRHTYLSDSTNPITIRFKKDTDAALK